ncbi:RHS repeat-associated core domain-containing protein [Tychonema sp. BBK16]|uniref:RHS repeat-associated core domain-containing protein n=1 Tax=Tychonema sp. BBK16 TaxID=2699888 RepID=UPI0038D25FC9
MRPRRRVRSRNCTSGVHNRLATRVYCENRRKPRPPIGKITPSYDVASGESIGFYYLRARYMSPKVGRFIAVDPSPGKVSDPLSVHKYQYAHLGPVANTDPSGLETLVGLNSGVGGSAVLSVAGQNLARVTVNRIAGKAFEKFVESQLRTFVSQHGGRLLSQVRFTGPGGLRVADNVVALGNRFVVIEAKTSFPLAGRALVRLGQQIRSFSLGTPAAGSGLTGTATEVIVVTEETAAALQASFAAVEGKVAVGTLSGVLQGSTELMMVLRALLLL